MTQLLEMKGISKSFSGIEVLHGVDFTVARGEIMALCGENGAGKSTLMKILAGVHEQDSGDIIYKGQSIRRNASPLEVQKLGISMIHQELNLLNELSVAQNIYLCREPTRRSGLINFGEMNERARELLIRLGQRIDPRQKVRELKIAQKQMVEIAKAISFNVELLIMDEPTSVLTGKETKILFELIEHLSSESIGVVYISHRLKEFAEVCHSVTVLRNGSLVAVRKVQEVTVKEIASLMVGHEVRESRVTNFHGDQREVVLEVRGVSDHTLKDVSFKVHGGEILGFGGLVGAGRSELMEVVFGTRKAEKGEVLIEGKPASVNNALSAIKANVGFVTEDRKETGLVLCRDIRQNVNYVYWQKTKGLFVGNAASANARRMIHRLRIDCVGPTQAVANLSGGNQQKVVLAKWLLSNPKVLLLDEPTRGVDVGAREEIYEIIRGLADEGIAIVIVSSDLPEILGICQRVLVMHEGKITGELQSTEMTEEKIMYYATNV